MYNLWNVVRIKMKEQGKVFFISFFINLFFVPMIIWGTYQRYGLDNETKMQIIKFTQYFTPVLVLTGLLYSFTKYVDQTGNEIFFVIKRMKWREVLYDYIGYIVLNTWVFGIYGIFFDNMLLEWIRVAIETFLIVSMAYCLVFATKNVAATFVVILIYAFGSVRSMNIFFRFLDIIVGNQ